MADVLFQVISFGVLPFWLLMIVLPRWRVTHRIIHSPWILLPLPILYAILVVPLLPVALPLMLSARLDDIAALLGTREAALVGWIHFLAFDLFVGRWIFLDSRERRLSAWLTAPVLFLTLMLGPCGLLAYLGLRPWWPAAAPPCPHGADSAQGVTTG